MIRAWDKPIYIKQTNKNKVRPKTDIIITELKENVSIELDENNNPIKTITYEPIKTNLTKKINATAKKLKIDTNLEILEKIGLVINEEE